MLKIIDLTVSVNNQKIIDKFNYSFEDNKIYAILGPNGSGKSTLVHTIMGDPIYSVSQGKIVFNNKNITNLSSDKRATSGIYLSFQNPLTINGVTIFQLLRIALHGKIDPLRLKNNIQKYAKKLKINDELLNRSLNEGASGGERKKLEVLQSKILDRQLQIFDEIDTGVDIDSLKTIGNFLKKEKKNKTYIFITHHDQILKYLQPDRVLILNKGRLIKEGNNKLIQEIEKSGYEKFNK